MLDNRKSLFYLWYELMQHCIKTTRASKKYMVTINNEPIIQAVEQHEQPKFKIAVFADSNLPSLEKTLRGDIDVTLTSLDKLAGYLGFDVEVNFIPRVSIAEGVAV